MRKRFLARVLAVFFLVLGMASCQVEQSSEPTADLYVAVSTNSAEEVALARNFLQSLSVELSGREQLDLDFMHEDVVENVYSNQADPFALEHKIETIQTKPSTDEAILAALTRVLEMSEQREGRDILGFILTPGTQQASTLTDLVTMAEMLTDFHKTHVWIVGLSGENRLPMSEPFKPIRDRVNFASSASGEWLQIIDQL